MNQPEQREELSFAFYLWPMNNDSSQQLGGGTVSLKVQRPCEVDHTPKSISGQYKVLLISKQTTKDPQNVRWDRKGWVSPGIFGEGEYDQKHIVQNSQRNSVYYLK